MWSWIAEAFEIAVVRYQDLLSVKLVCAFGPVFHRLFGVEAVCAFGAVFHRSVLGVKLVCAFGPVFHRSAILLPVIGTTTMLRPGAVATGSTTTCGASIILAEGLRYRSAAIAVTTRISAVFILIRTSLITIWISIRIARVIIRSVVTRIAVEERAIEAAKAGKNVVVMVVMTRHEMMIQGAETPTGVAR